MTLITGKHRVDISLSTLRTAARHATIPRHKALRQNHTQPVILQRAIPHNLSSSKQEPGLQRVYLPLPLLRLQLHLSSMAPSTFCSQRHLQYVKLTTGCAESHETVSNTKRPVRRHAPCLLQFSLQTILLLLRPCGFLLHPLQLRHFGLHPSQLCLPVFFEEKGNHLGVHPAVDWWISSSLGRSFDFDQSTGTWMNPLGTIKEAQFLVSKPARRHSQNLRNKCQRI